MTPAEKVQQFLTDEGLIVNAFPEFVARDDGTYSTVVRVTVTEKPSQKTEAQEADTNISDDSST